MKQAQVMEMVLEYLKALLYCEFDGRNRWEGRWDEAKRPSNARLLVDERRFLPDVTGHRSEEDGLDFGGP
ncbi:hypothetical protein HDV05_005810 [Chytridiales sp. JEL 0842]|nr:hypothetical protein HDV05_005810 [Chytridiales sp. JEL 0842]